MKARVKTAASNATQGDLTAATRAHLGVPACCIHHIAAALVVPRQQHLTHLQWPLVMAEPGGEQDQRPPTNL